MTMSLSSLSNMRWTAPLARVMYCADACADAFLRILVAPATAAGWHWLCVEKAFMPLCRGRPYLILHVYEEVIHLNANVMVLPCYAHFWLKGYCM